jgi:predicted transcriptional regulator
MVSVASAISAISNEKALSLFKTVAFSERYRASILLTKLEISRRKFYSIVKKLIDAGLIKRTRSEYHLTSFGKVVLSEQAKVEITINYHCQLKALDSIMMPAEKSQFPEEMSHILVDKLIDNNEIKQCLFDIKSHSNYIKSKRTLIEHKTKNGMNIFVNSD